MGATPRKKTQALQDNPQKNTSFFQYNKPKKVEPFGESDDQC
jgi:hypothetical protein